MSPFFSVIVPVYNCEKYLKECIESVIGQTYESWELILVDDGSTDASGKICDFYSDDFRIKVIHQKNSGELASRLRGINVAEGVYELGLDADDFLELNCLETIKKAVDCSGCDLIFYAFQFVDKKTGICLPPLPAESKYTRKEILKEVIRSMNHSMCNKAIKLDLVKGVDHIGLDNEVRFNLDYAQIIPILCNINSGYVISDVLYNYRIYDTSISNLCKVKHVLDTGIVSKYVIQVLKDNMLLDEVIYKYINIAYLKTIAYRLFVLFLQGRINNKECEEIHLSDAYICTKKFERCRNITFKNYFILKMFRYKQYWGIKCIALIKNIRDYKRKIKNN